MDYTNVLCYNNNLSWQNSVGTDFFPHNYSNKSSIMSRSQFRELKTDVKLTTKGHFTKVYSIKGCELQNFPEILQ